MGMAKMGNRYPEYIYFMRSVYQYFGKNLKRTEQFFVQEFGLPKRYWDDIPKSLITAV